MRRRLLLDYDHKKGTITFYSKSEVHRPGESANPVEEVIWDKGNNSKATQHEINHFVDCVLTGAKPLTDGESALRSLRVIWKLYDAEKFGIVADLRDI